ncbi:MAG: hypothetical protein UU23_C0001G0140 [Candidatus Curtissbacteria bacterium GW2011_GWA1_40_9]|uniref:Peptidase S24/S26A/S26B/S26C domain-containing protein n=1 Tax=Candidatus Curtissbacteria bacterium GW2011_GWA1_40_9 TaxID=1618408 RepID=A0A0G0TU62_9BACT|nr:MAG: hypothetical protein UU23_C0001G0140 [Candidatus Curtissbacteria bacterium GW2011_GWA1_40_9]
MEPMFVEFDRVLTINYGTIQKGSIIVFRQGANYLIKRVKDVGGDNIIAVSDNKILATKQYTVKRVDVIGRVFLKY